jgi:ABC-2 type transport system ATP-binding protein
MVPIIKTDGLTKDYGRVRGLDSLTLEVQEGEVLGFLGPNGSGKTTTIRLLLDLIRPTRGSASIGGFDCQRQSLGARRLIGYLPGEMPIYPELTGEAYLAYLGRLGADPPDPDTAQRLLARFDIGPADRKRRMRDLSHGMKRKFGIVSALMTRPRVAILDEPTSGLDPLVQEEVARILEEVVADGRTVFFSSHVLPEVERLSHSVAIIRAGRIVAVEDVASLKGRSVQVVQVTFAAPPPVGLFALPGVQELHRDGNTVRVQASDSIDAVIKAIARYEIVDLRTEQPNLEDVFLAFYSEHGGGDVESGQEQQHAAS